MKMSFCLKSNLNSALNMNLLRTPCKSALFKNRFFGNTFCLFNI
ncbi:hypothetical protein T01_13090 [Trichinella spiralis]|uniref:Uncharacterized protein n=1 Tax=Trichinella spiralis TaxID=6334 RepID=A0A0V0YUB4_TRISP|nr:hypothetical protein T01_13090 [Trichinella spiralis]